MIRILMLLSVMLPGIIRVHGQHHEELAEAIPPQYNETLPHDSLKRVLHDMGKFEGHFRSYFMSTSNQGDNPDYFALAIGGGLAYYSPIVRNFQVAMSGFIIHNVASSDLAPDGTYVNRYELALFDIRDPGNTKDLDRLENLYLRYYFTSHHKSFLQFGKFHLSTPLINLQDTRMRPNLQEGLWAELKDWDKIKFRAGWLWRTSPRSTVEWFGIGESIGIYGSGFGVTGEPARYEGHVRSKRIVIGNLEWQPSKSVNYQGWNYYVDNLFNTALQKLEVKKQFVHHTWMAGAQYLWQHALSRDDRPLANQYISQGEQSHVLSGRLAVTNIRNSIGWSLNYTRITSHGRFLFPREWGTETFYTSNSRERSEGTGDVHAVMLEHTRHIDKGRRVFVRARGGIYEMPAFTDNTLNKYSLPSYYHFTLQTNYKFNGFLKGLEGQMLYAYKGNLENNTEVQPVVVHNKTQMHHLGVRLDYYF